MNAPFAVQHLTPAIGSEVSGLDLAQPLAADTVAALRTLWLGRKVLFFRDQRLTPDQQLAFTGQFGELEKYPFLPGIEGYPLIAPVLKLPHETVNFGGLWHSDTTYLEAPAAGATLYAIEIPPLGGDTLFANMVLAYETLPEDIKARIQGLKVVNSSAKADVTKTREDRLKEVGGSAPRQEFVSIHPVVRTHPETGEKILYVNEGHAIHFDGWTEADSLPLLEALYKHQRKPEFQCRFRWSPGALAMWDNRSCQHYPVNDYHGHRRLLHRISLKGDRPA
ncbi:MAG: TauD/TfdA family dioxygenase [Pseudomonadales bacterium]|nr:TauD/TfdA family dioxygenase [Pseudomonadales bacterium]